LDVLAQALMKSGDLASAERLLERALQYDPSYAPAHLHLGMIYWLRGDATAAYQEFRQVYELAPESPAAEQVNRLLEGLGKP
jgi:type IV pilus assembly protein PilF